MRGAGRRRRVRHGRRLRGPPDAAGASRAGPETVPHDPGPTYTFGSGLKLNIYGVFYGVVSIGLGLAWYVELQAIRGVLALASVFGIELDKNKRAYCFVSHLWGMMTLRCSNCWPVISGREHTADLGREAPAMYVANHCSWMDIPFLAAAIGWRNYKIVAKQELLKVPILGTSIRLGGHVVIDRSSRRSQLDTYKKGIAWLKAGVNLCTFPEGTRSRGRLGPFKRGAFKMAQAEGAPIVPISIRYAHVMNPKDWVFPFRSGAGVPVEIRIHPPIPTVGKGDEDLLREVRDAMVSGLPECQHPDPDAALDET